MWMLVTGIVMPSGDYGRWRKTVGIICKLINSNGDTIAIYEEGRILH